MKNNTRNDDIEENREWVISKLKKRVTEKIEDNAIGDALKIL